MCEPSAYACAHTSHWRQPSSPAMTWWKIQGRYRGDTGRYRGDTWEMTWWKSETQESRGSRTTWMTRTSGGSSTPCLSSICSIDSCCCDQPSGGQQGRLCGIWCVVKTRETAGSWSRYSSPTLPEATSDSSSEVTPHAYGAAVAAFPSPPCSRTRTRNCTRALPAHWWPVTHTSSGRARKPRRRWLHVPWVMYHGAARRPLTRR